MYEGFAFNLFLIIFFVVTPQKEFNFGFLVKFKFVLEALSAKLRSEDLLT